MRTKTYNLSGQTSSATSVAAAANPVAGTPLTLTASPVVFGTQKTNTGSANLNLVPPGGTPSEITITTAASAVANTFLVVGLDRWGQPISETISAPAAGTFTSTKVYSQINSITPSVSDATHTASAGVPQRVTTPWVPLNNLRGFDQSELAYVAIDSAVATPTAILETTSEALNSFGLGVNNTYNQPTFTGDAAPIDTTSAAITIPQTTANQAIPAGAQFARIVITSAAGSSLVARFVRPGF